MFSFEFCEISQKTFFIEHLQKTAHHQNNLEDFATLEIYKSWRYSTMQAVTLIEIFHLYRFVLQ